MLTVYVFIFLCALLVAGKIIRLNAPLLQRLYLPSSVIGGFLGLLVLSVADSAVPPAFTEMMRNIPGFLINVVFATLFLGSKVPRFGKIIRLSLPQLCCGQISAWGQYAIGLGLTGFVLAPLFGVPPVFGNLIEIGFQGGHGTVGGMAESFRAIAWEDGIALGYTVATVGMVCGIVIGMILINWAYKKGIISSVRPFHARRREERRGLHLRGTRPVAGYQTVMSDSVDSLAWHLAIVGISIAIGAGIHALLPMKGFPLFPLCMMGGILLQFFVRKAGKDMLIDRVQMERISGASLDFLVVSAVATIRLDVVLAHWMPLLALVVAGVVWSAFTVLYFGPRLFQTAWFERAIADFGQATGVTATGLMLLRTVDPENKTCAAASFGYKQLLHEPVMGGGLWTAFAFVLVSRWGWLPVFLLSTGALVFWILFSRSLRKWGMK
jgi:ESS family glutamate:Na+ symporter